MNSNLNSFHFIEKLLEYIITACTIDKYLCKKVNRYWGKNLYKEPKVSNNKRWQRINSFVFSNVVDNFDYNFDYNCGMASHLLVASAVDDVHSHGAHS